MKPKSKRKADPVLAVLLHDSNVNLDLYECKKFARGLYAVLDNGRFAGGYRLNVDTSLWRVVGDLSPHVTTEAGVAIFTKISSENMVDPVWLAKNFKPTKKGLRIYSEPRLFKMVCVMIRVENHSKW